jgi:5'-methylthioadenosine phosphorylase
LGPSGPLLTGEIAGLPIVFLSHHDKGHRLSPSDINYRAHIDVLKRAGVIDLDSLSACSSVKAELPPGTFVLIDHTCRPARKAEAHTYTVFDLRALCGAAPVRQFSSPQA